MANPKLPGRRTLKMLKDDLREVLSLYDLEIFEDDGHWFWHSDKADSYEITLVPFSAHRPFGDTRGAKKGSKTEFGPVKAAK